MSLADGLFTGLTLTVMGMGLVFLLLAILWGLLTLLLRLDREPTSQAAEGGGAAVTPAMPPSAPDIAADGPDPDLRSAIAVAVLIHQAALRKQAAPTMRSHWPGSLLYASRWVAAGRHQQIENWHPRKH
jgi:Na+-transporting methylmalonyl-CoA/oxaloacetate decarboxylase gamma subunit